MDIIFLIGQILFGGILLMMSANHFMKTNMMVEYSSMKKVPAPKVAVLLSGLVLMLGALGVLLGAYATIALWLIVIFLVVVSLKMHDFWTVQDPQAKMAEMTNFLKNMALAGAALMMLSLPHVWPFALNISL